MVVGFNPRFKEPILSKTKKHTIREDPHNRWKAGMKMHMATGVRTKRYNQFDEQVCVSTQKIEITRNAEYINDVVVKIDGRRLTVGEFQQLAWNDGFDNIVDFCLWFEGSYAGKIIHWTELRY